MTSTISKTTFRWFIEILSTQVMMGLKVIVSIIAVVFFSKRLIKEREREREREREKDKKKKKRKEKLIQSNKNDYVSR